MHPPQPGQPIPPQDLVNLPEGVAVRAHWPDGSQPDQYFVLSTPGTGEPRWTVLTAKGWPDLHHRGAQWTLAHHPHGPTPQDLTYLRDALQAVTEVADTAAGTPGNNPAAGALHDVATQLHRILLTARIASLPGPNVLDCFTNPDQCPEQPHREPQGPNEDIAQCGRCGAPTWSLRPDGEEFGGHLPDCSLPRRHTGYCTPGGNGHPEPRVRRG